MKLVVLLLMVLVATGGRATATTVDAGIRRGASVFVCEQLRWAGVSDSKVAERTYRFRIVQHDGQAMLAVYSDLYDFGSTRGIMDFTMGRIYDGRWGVYEYGFTPDSNESESKRIRSRFIGKPTGSFTTSRQACASYLAETSPLKSRMEAAALASVDNFRQWPFRHGACTQKGMAQSDAAAPSATQAAGSGCEPTPKLDSSNSKVCAFNEAYSQLYVVVGKKPMKQVYVVAIRWSLKDFPEKFIHYDDRVVRPLEKLNGEGIMEHC